MTVTHSGFVALPPRPVRTPPPPARRTSGRRAASTSRVVAERLALDQRQLLTSHRKTPRARKLNTSKLNTSNLDTSNLGVSNVDTSRPTISKFSTSRLRPARLRASKPSRLTMTVACSTVLAAGAAAGAVVAWPGPASARPAGGISDETLARVGTAARGSAAGQAGASQIVAGPAGPGRAITTFKGQHSQSVATTALAARQAAAAAAARAAAAKAAQAAQAAQQAAASSSSPAATADAAPPPVAVAPGSAEQIAMSMLGSYGWSSSQFSCLNELWSRESGWRTTAENPSGAYGIPQALPGSKMASAGPDWQTSATTQIRWGLGYIKGQYGSPCGAWSHEEATGWY
jgi:hypothetical protein